MNRNIGPFIIIILSLYCNILFAQNPMPQMGGDFRPSYESYRLDKFIEEGEASYSGNLQFSIALLTVPGRHGHNFDIKINYNSDIRQRQNASWVGLGWDLEIGAVERTINGRADEPGHNCSYGSLGLQNCTGRGNMGGRFKSDFLSDPLEFRDVADQYQLSIDGGGMQIVPFSDSLMISYYDSVTVSYDDFLPVQYKPWYIGSYLDSDGAFKGYIVHKEDGSEYTYGNIGTVGAGQVEWQRVGDMGIYSNPPQQYKFPYRWNLNKIEYPDGSKSIIEYEFQNSSDNRLYRRYESVMIDRSKTNNLGNLFGNLPTSLDNLCPNVATSPSQVDSVWVEYAHPTTLTTDTHYLVFKTSSNTNDVILGTERNCRLDTLILYERYTNKELKRITFQYAGSDNHLDDCNSSNVSWVSGERLKNDQLTLIGFTIGNGAVRPPLPKKVENEIDSEALKYNFTYTTNPNIYIEGISRYANGSYNEWPGHYSFASRPDLGSAWRLKTMILPTGGRYTYDYETYLVNYDPEGNYNNTDGWNYSSEPTSRVTNKKFEDGFDVQRVWSYSYSPQVVYDPPSSVNQSSFVPAVFRTGLMNSPYEYHKWVRSCTVGHRWVQITNPDGSWKKVYFTSSYQGDSAYIQEKQPDYFVQTTPLVGQVFSKSFAGCRGLVWKEETGTGTTVRKSMIYKYFFQPQAYLKDRYDYFSILGPLQARVYSLITSFWPRLDEKTETTDGIATKHSFGYNFTPRWAPAENGLIRDETVVTENGVLKTTTYGYAHSNPAYLGMKNIGMLSQLENIAITSWDGVGLIEPESVERTTWAQFSGYWLPSETYILEMLDSNRVYKWVRLRTLNYDNSGYCNVINQTNANDFTTKYYYGNASNPFTNTTEGLEKGLITGVEYPISSPLLRTSYKYDHFGNVIEKTDENLNTTRAVYDKVGRIINIKDPLERLNQRFSYFMPSDNNLITPSDPNSITATLYRSLSEFTIVKKFYDGAGYERQKMLSVGDKDIVTATTYDPLWQVQKSYRPYLIDLGVNKHKYDTGYQNNAIIYYGFNPPYIANEYYTDGTGRIKKITPEGVSWQTHPVNYTYSTLQGLFQTLITDENNIISNDFFDKFGRKIRTIRDVGGLNLTNEFKYDIMDRIIGVRPPSRSYSEFDTSKTSYMPYPTTSKIISIDVPEDTGKKYFQVIVTTDISPKSLSPGDAPDNLCPYIRYTYQQYLNGNLVFESPNIGLALECDGTNNSMVFASPNPNVDNIRLNINEVVYNKHQISYEIKFIYKSIDESFTATYVYNKRGLLTEKTSVDAGTVEYSYDKVGNLRFTKDANQIVTGKFTYNKYDALNRLVQTGLYTGSSSFTGTNAEDINFPLDDDENKTINEQYYFDNSFYSGQRNLLGKLSKSIVNKDSSTVQTSYYSYDEMGRVEWLVRQIPSLPDVKISYWYDYQGNPTKKCLSDATNGSVYTFYEYDAAGRLSKVYTNYIDSDTGKIKEAEYTYNADGSRKRVQLGDAQGMDYVYNERGWVKQINQQNFNIIQDPGGDGGTGTTTTIDKFAEIIGYEEQGHIAAGPGFTFQPQYNGNISWSFSRIKDVSLSGVNAGYPDPMIGYVYNYDNANRLTKADFGYYHATSGWNNTLPKSSMYELPTITYSPDGNISSLQRYGVNATMENNFAYNYLANTNRLATLTNTASGTQTYNYSYDQNGNVISDQLRDITDVVYNSNNLPEQLVNSIDATVNYTYDEGNNRIRKQDGTTDEYYLLGATGETEAVYSGTGSVTFVNILAGENLGRLIPITSNLSLTNTILVGNYQAQSSITAQTNVVVNGTATLTAATTIYLKPGFSANSGCNFTAGIGAVNSEKFYYLKDHLGSTRVTVDKLGNICSYDDYDPYGLQLASRSGNFGYANDKYKFTGKERDSETGYDYFGARYYDSRIGRWLQVDPLADKYPGWSPYNYVENNPLRLIDPDGAGPWDFIQGAVDALYAGITGKDKSGMSEVSDVGDYRTGELVGNVASGLLGTALITSGMVGEVEYGGLALVTGGTSTPVSTLGIVASTTSIVLGTNILNNTIENINSGGGDPKQNSQTEGSVKSKDGSKKTAQEQYNEIKNAELKATKNRPKTKGKDADPEWEGSKRPKQSKINSTSKSEKRQLDY